MSENKGAIFFSPSKFTDPLNSIYGLFKDARLGTPTLDSSYSFFKTQLKHPFF